MPCHPLARPDLLNTLARRASSALALGAARFGTALPDFPLAVVK